MKTILKAYLLAEQNLHRYTKVTYLTYTKLGSHTYHFYLGNPQLTKESERKEHKSLEMSIKLLLNFRSFFPAPPRVWWGVFLSFYSVPSVNGMDVWGPYGCESVDAHWETLSCSGKGWWTPAVCRQPTVERDRGLLPAS